MASSEMKDLYYVAVKLLIREGDKLLITHDIFNAWDIPGGRIKIDEFETPLESVIDRKLNEELGPDVQIAVKAPVVFFRHQRVEHATGEQARIFAVGYEAQYLGGQIQLGQHHDAFEWVEVHTFKPETYFTGGWLKGLQEYLDSLSRGSVSSKNLP